MSEFWTGFEKRAFGIGAIRQGVQAGMGYARQGMQSLAKRPLVQKGMQVAKTMASNPAVQNAASTVSKATGLANINRGLSMASPEAKKELISGVKRMGAVTATGAGALWAGNKLLSPKPPQNSY